MTRRTPPASVFRLGYNTNGLAHHRMMDALDLLADLGYEAIAITPDAGQLDPDHLDAGEVRRVRQRAERLGLALAVETGARYLLDPRRKHSPSLLDADREARARRSDFLRRSIDLASDLGASLVSIWSGVAPDGRVAGRAGPDAETAALWDRLASGVADACEHARARSVRLAFEPEPGMFVERPSEYRELARRVGSGAGLGLCLDVGHLLVTGDLPVERAIRDHAHEIVHVHLDDIAHGVHTHRMFGEGDLDLAGTLSALVAIQFDGMAAVELSRDSHRGADAAREAMGHLRRALLHTT